MATKRRIRFGVKFLLVAVLILSGLCALALRSGYEQQLVINELERRGCQVTFDNQQSNSAEDFVARVLGDCYVFNVSSISCYEGFDRFDLVLNQTKLRSLALHDCAIKNLNGIQHLTNLQTLYLRWSEMPIDQELLDSIGKAQSLSKLTIMDAYDSQIDLRFVGNLDRLESIKVRASIEDLSPLNKCQNLRALHIEEYLGQSIGDSSEFSSVLELFIQRSPELNDINGLKTCKGMHELVLLDAPKLTNIDAIADMPKLRKLNLRQSPVTLDKDLSSDELTFLDIRSSEEVRLECLKQCSAIQEMIVRNLNSTRSDELGPFQKLETLQIYDSVLDSADFEVLCGAKMLEFLWLAAVDIDDISFVSKCHRLEYLGLEKTQVESLVALSGLENINDLSVADSPVNSLDGIQELRLYCLDIRGSRVRSFGSSCFPRALSKLYVDKSQLEKKEIANLRKKYPGLEILN